MKSIFSIFLFFFVICLATERGDAQTLYGIVKDEQTGEVLNGAHVWVVSEKKGSHTDEYGRYHLRVSGFPVQVICSYVGYLADTVEIIEVPEGGLDFVLGPATLDEIVVSESRWTRKEKIGVLHMPIEQLTKNKFFLGEEDIIRALASLPGVSLGNTARNGLYVRGSDPEHNLFLLDGTPVYNTGHLFGMFSIFNSSTVKDVKLYKGDLPARYGARLASVIDVNTREGNRHKYTSEYKIGLLSASGLWEGPVGDRASVMGAVRSSYLGLVLLPMWLQYKSGRKDNSINYWMYDLNLKGNWRPTEKDHFFVSVYHGNDGIPIRNRHNEYENIQYLRWGNTTTSMRYSRFWSPALFSKFQLYNAQYTNILKFTGLGNGSGEMTDYRKLGDRSTVGESGFFNQNDWLLSDFLKLHFGYHLQRYQIRPNQITFQINELDRSETLSNRDRSRPFWQNSFFLEGDLRPVRWLDLGMGIRASGYYLEEKENRWILEPRVSAAVHIGPRHTVKASYFESSQFLHQLTHYTFGAPSDFWVPTRGGIEPQIARQWSLGYGTSIFSGEYDLTVEMYRKSMKHLINFQEGTDFLFLLERDWTDMVEHDGVGKASGLEWFVHKKTGRWNGWAGYTLSWSKRKFENLNKGRWFYSTYDRRHDLEIFLSYQLKKGWEMSGSWQYQTGHRFSIPLTGTYYYLYYTEKNNRTLPAFHQLNIGFTRSRYVDERKKTEFSFGLYNAYGRSNPFYIERSSEYFWEKNIHGDSSVTKVRNTLKAVSLFNFLPYFSYKIKLDPGKRSE